MPAAQFRRNNCRDDRRRRLLADEFVGAGSKTVSGGSEAVGIQHRSQNYGEAEFFDEQPRLFELIPRRLWKIGLAGLLGLGAVAGLLFLHGWTPIAAQPQGLAAFDLAAKGSLANWLTAVGLIAAAVAAVAVYSIRRYKIDDYNGHYRIWLWAAMCWTLLSADISASLHEGFQAAMIHLTGTPLVGDGWIWWLLLYFFLVGAVGSRLAVDMWPARLSLSALAAAAACCAVGVMNRAGWLADDALQQLLVEAGTRMTAVVLLLLAMTLHARYVLMDAEGLLPRREPKPKQEPADETKEPAATSSSSTSSPQPWLYADPPHSTPPQPAYQSPKPAVSPTSTPAAKPALAFGSSSPSTSSAPNSSLPDASSVNRKLTKQEKKALKDRLLRERLQREGKWK